MCVRDRDIERPCIDPRESVYLNWIHISMLWLMAGKREGQTWGLSTRQITMKAFCTDGLDGINAQHHVILDVDVNSLLFFLP